MAARYYARPSEDLSSWIGTVGTMQTSSSGFQKTLAGRLNFRFGDVRPVVE